jgi:hypothetical protein
MKPEGSLCVPCCESIECSSHSSILLLYKPLEYQFSHLCLGLPSGLFHAGIPTTTLYAFLFSLIYARCSTILITDDEIRKESYALGRN